MAGMADIEVFFSQLLKYLGVEEAAGMSDRGGTVSATVPAADAAPNAATAAGADHQ